MPQHKIVSGNSCGARTLCFKLKAEFIREVKNEERISETVSLLHNFIPDSHLLKRKLLMRIKNKNFVGQEGEKNCGAFVFEIVLRFPAPRITVICLESQHTKRCWPVLTQQISTKLKTGHSNGISSISSIQNKY